MSGWRSTSGIAIDRSKPIHFRWAGKSYQGFAGDTLASALIANGIVMVGRSFKYHRPRGLVAAGLEEPNGIVQLEQGAHTVPNLKAPQIELYEGLVAGPVNAKPSVEFDIMAVNSQFKRFIPAAFYYKTFFWPNWHIFEPSIRKAAGLGLAPREADPDSYEHRFAHVDTLVIGSGAAGLAAAETAATLPGNERVMLIETDFEFGGGLLSALEKVEGCAPLIWREAILARLRTLPNVQLLNRTMAFGHYDHNFVALAERINDHLLPGDRSGPRQRLWKVRAARVILATGAFERPIAFSNNDLPGVMLASAAQIYALRYGAMPGRRIILCTNNDSAYTAAIALSEAGCRSVTVVDSRKESGLAAASARKRGIVVIGNAVPLAARGRRAVKALDIAAPDGSGRRRLNCDAILSSDGWNPAVHLHSQSGGALTYDDALQAFLPKANFQDAVNIGAAAGIFDLAAAITDARAAVRGEARDATVSKPVGPTRRFADGDAAAATAWLDFQNDVTVADVQLASRENFRSVEHLKRYTTLGMASDQGKTSNISGIHTLSALLDKPPVAIGTTKFRPPFDPVTIGAFAGRAVGQDLMPMAHTATHAVQLALGGVMEPYGRWMRAAYFGHENATEHQAIEREVQAVRTSVGLFDASPLGKIEVKGPDAAEFLQRIYVGSVRSLKPGQCRYGLMLDEHGIVYDDGVFARIGENHYLVGTTSGHASAIAETLNEWLQCEWPHLRVVAENVTTGWAVINIAGPRSRDVLTAIGTDVDLSADAFPHMQYRAGTVGGVSARIQRISFTGELSYEVAVPWGYGASLWDALMYAGQDHGIAPFGVEALMVMRLEKGFLHVGSDTDGTTYPQDLGFGAAIDKKKDDFVGRRSIMRPDGMRADRRQLVGLEVTDGGGPIAVGAHVLSGDAVEAQGTQGWVTSSAQSPTLDRPIAMGLVERGTERLGEAVLIWDMGNWRGASIADARFYDPSGTRLNG